MCFIDKSTPNFAFVVLSFKKLAVYVDFLHVGKKSIAYSVSVSRLLLNEFPY